MLVVCSIIGLLILAASSAKGRRVLATVTRAADQLANGLIAAGLGFTLLALLVVAVLWML